MSQAHNRKFTTIRRASAEIRARQRRAPPKYERVRPSLAARVCAAPDSGGKNKVLFFISAMSYRISSENREEKVDALMVNYVVERERRERLESCRFFWSDGNRC